ncbi:hypothetical protein [Streptomyces boninensis]|uniref:hypothetical protein n=1 Tax=Streptomyces boninensis TaxID=2039455 RepID=UPI003B20CC0F
MIDNRRGRTLDVLTATLAAALFAVAAGIGHWLARAYDTPKVDWPPLYADWLPHTGPGSLAAAAIAVAVVSYGPTVTRALPWRALLAATWLASTAWLWSLALIDGWHRGVADRLTTKHEYVQPDVIARLADLSHALRTYTDHILLDSPDNWPAHLAGHPPAAGMTFMALHRLGLGGGAWGAAFVITVAGSAAVAVLVTLRALTGEDTARTAAPFLVLAPWAIWAGVSADGYFAAVAAWGIALVAVAATSAGRTPLTALAAGLLLGWSLYLSYGLTLMAIPALTVLCLTRTLRPLPWVLLGIAAVAIAFTASGFDWYEGYRTLHERYYQGVARIRPYSYWVWANLACAAAVAGPAAAAGLRRAFAATTRRATPDHCRALAWLALAGLAALLAATLSGLSKAETERIWLPFTLWLLPAAALLPRQDHRRWLAVQAGIALALNHLLLTGW